MESGLESCLSLLSAKSQRSLISKPPKCRKEVTTLDYNHEPYHISHRFYLALHAKADTLENDAQKDEIFASTLVHPGHLERQYRLIQTQRDQARRLREFLAASEIHVG